MAGNMPRVLGQQVEVMLIAANVVKETITDIRSFDFAAMLEILREGYLGETTDRRDEKYNGVKGKIALHIENQDILVLMRQLVERARTRVPGFAVNIKVTVRMSNGDRPIVVIRDVKFGEIPFNVGGRGEFVSVDLDWEADDFTLTIS